MKLSTPCYDNLLHELTLKRGKQQATHLACDAEWTTGVPHPKSPDVHLRKKQVWQIGYENVETGEFYDFPCLDNFFNHLFKHENYCFLYFHNGEKADFWFIMNWLFENDFKRLEQTQDYRGAYEKCFVGDKRGFTIYYQDKMYSLIDSLHFKLGSIKGISEDLENVTTVKGDTPLYDTIYDVLDRHPLTAIDDNLYFRMDCFYLAEYLRQSKRYIGVEQGYTTISKIAYDEMMKDKVWEERKPFKPRHPYRVFNKKHLRFYESFEGYELLNGKWQPVVVTDDSLIDKKMNELDDLYHLDEDKYIKKVAPYYAHAYELPEDFVAPHEGNDEITEAIIRYNEQGTAMKLERQKQYNRQYELNKFFKRSYKGGLTGVNPDIAGKEVGACESYDVNSMHPSQYWKRLPGDVVESHYKVEGGVLRPNLLDDTRLFIVEFKVLHAIVKVGRLPIIKARSEDQHYNDMQRKYYLPVVEMDNLVMTSVEYGYLQKHYDVLKMEIERIEIFEDLEVDKHQKMKDFIVKQMNIKENSTGLLRSEAKLAMNSNYGRMGYFGKEVKRYDVLFEQGMVKRKPYADREIGLVNAPVQVASFITAYSRVQLAETANRVGLKNVYYYDTDSLYVRKGSWKLETHPTKLGYWCKEGDWRNGKFIRAKVYAKLADEWKFTVAGYNGSGIDYEQFGMGMIHLSYKRTAVPGGIDDFPHCMFIGGREWFVRSSSEYETLIREVEHWIYESGMDVDEAWELIDRELLNDHWREIRELVVADWQEEMKLVSWNMNKKRFNDRVDEWRMREQESQGKHQLFEESRLVESFDGNDGDFMEWLMERE